jgi:hypothetical protein
MVVLESALERERKLGATVGAAVVDSVGAVVGLVVVVEAVGAVVGAAVALRVVVVVVVNFMSSEDRVENSGGLPRKGTRGSLPANPAVDLPCD